MLSAHQLMSETPVTLIVRSRIEACGHFCGDDHNPPSISGTLKLLDTKIETMLTTFSNLKEVVRGFM